MNIKSNLKKIQNPNTTVNDDLSNIPTEPPKKENRKSIFQKEGNYYTSTNDTAPIIPNDNPNTPNSDRKYSTTTNEGIRRSVVTQEQKPESKYKFWQVEYYQDYFNVDNREILIRILRAIFPFKFNFVELIHEKPDLYGPFWITTTLIFLMAASANFASYLVTIIEGKSTFTYDFLKIPYGAAVLYGYVTIIPLGLYLFFKWVEIKISYLEIMCCYGYSLFIYCFTALVCILPNVMVQWVAVSIACLISTIFLIFNLWVPIRTRIAKAFIMVVVMVLLHVGLALSFKLYFFAFTTPK